tara:strand:+ start:270 stop:602 length:333 start_codon:yes stop_codon:yes gene_type:complete
MATKRSLGKSLTSSLVDIYEVPDHRLAEWVLVFITNTSGSNGNYTLTYYDDSESASLPILDGFQISSKEYLQIGGEAQTFIMMEEGDKIQASGTQAGTILVSIIEHNTNR